MKSPCLVSDKESCFLSGLQTGSGCPSLGSCHTQLSPVSWVGCSVAVSCSEPPAGTVGAQMGFQAEDGPSGMATSEAARLCERPLVCKPQRFKTHLFLLFPQHHLSWQTGIFYNAGCVVETCYLLLCKQLDWNLWITVKQTLCSHCLSWKIISVETEHLFLL